MIARADGSTIAANDPTATKVINALIEDYLRGKVLQARIDARTVQRLRRARRASRHVPSKK